MRKAESRRQKAEGGRQKAGLALKGRLIGGVAGGGLRRKAESRTCFEGAQEDSRRPAVRPTPPPVYSGLGINAT